MEAFSTSEANNDTVYIGNPIMIILPLLTSKLLELDGIDRDPALVAIITNRTLEELDSLRIESDGDDLNPKSLYADAYLTKILGFCGEVSARLLPGQHWTPVFSDHTRVSRSENSSSGRAFYMITALDRQS